MTNPFKPSIKLEPLITIKTQKVVKMIFIALYVNK